MKTEVKNRIEAASVACEKAIAQWQAATAALNGNVRINGFGIIHDPSAFRQKLYEAQARIAASFEALDAVTDWPSGVDYDQV